MKRNKRSQFRVTIPVREANRENTESFFENFSHPHCNCDCQMRIGTGGKVWYECRFCGKLYYNSEIVS